MLGNIHQGTLGTMGISRSFGTQCTAIAIVALIFASFHLHPHAWSSENLDTIIFEGDRLYNRIIDGFYNGDSSVMLAHDDIPSVTEVFGTSYHTELYSTLYGLVESNPAQRNQSTSVQSALNNAFSMSNHMLATFGSTSVAVLRRGRSYFIFDSHSRNGLGEVDPDGVCVLLEFSSRDALYGYLFQTYEGQAFNLSPVIFQSINTASSGSSVYSTNYLSDHKYYSVSEPKPKRKKQKHKESADVFLDTAPMEFASPCFQNINENMHENVGSYVEIQSSCSVREYQSNINRTVLQTAENCHLSDYEEFIRRTPVFSCISCLRFLFKNQTHFLTESKLNNITNVLGINTSSVLCCTCKKYLGSNKVPAICAKLNGLEVNIIPSELSCLNVLEKKLLSKIQTFFTMIILPGGQYAEKGMVLNLPRNVSVTADKVSNLPDLNQMCLVRFENSNPIGQQSNYLIRPSKLIAAFSWLKEHNSLYMNLTFSTSVNGSCPRSQSVECDVDETINTVNSLEQVTLTQVNCSSTLNVADCLSVRNSTKNTQSITVPHIHNKPVSIYELEDGEESAFPWLFPEGKHGFLFPRMHKLTPSMYFRSRLYNKLGFWRKDINYLLHAAVAYDTMLLKQEINIYMKMCKSQSNDQSGNVSMTAGDVRSYRDSPEVIQNSYMFMKNIRGTVAYFRNALFDLLAMFRTLGPPSLFVTLSANDLHWPELGMILENLSYSESLKKGSFFSSMRSDPLMTAIHFERRLNALMKFVLKSDLKPLGEIVDWFIRVEFQLRGSPHYHIFFWISDLCNRQGELASDDGIILQYIDRTIKTTIPNEKDDKELYDLVRKLQMHTHTSYCMPSNRPPCRFGFPKRECKDTHLLSLVQSLKNKGKFYETRRTSDSLYVNAYNPVILKHWKANMDIQVVNNAEGAAYYVCHYLCKSEPDELKCALSNLITSVFKQNPSMSPFQRLWNIGTCVLKHRRMSAQEAAFRLSNLKLLQNSRTVVYLNTRPLKKRYKMLRPVHELNLLPDDSSDIFMHNIVDYYYARPQSVQFVCLYEFASWYIKCAAPSQGMVTARMHERIYISAFDTWMRRRKHAAVVRYPTFSVSSDDYYYSLLMLMLPHSQESELLAGFESAKDAFMAKYSLLDTSMQMYTNFMVQVESAIRRIRLAEAELHDQAEYPHESSQYNFDLGSSVFGLDAIPVNGIQQNDVIDPDDDVIHFHELHSRMSHADFETNYIKMTNCQKRVVAYIRDFLTDSNEKPALRLFVTGGAGVGKSYLLKMIAAYLDLNTAIISGSSPVKCIAPTGTAARNIRGVTLHSLLKIPVEKYLNYAALSAYHLQQLRASFAGVHTIIIDEISMVSDRMFTFVSRRLSEISGSSEPFGNFNIILFGDFFQLPPVKGKFVFHNKMLWNLFKPVFLRENVRQAGDTEYAALLNRARVGMLSSADIEFLKTKLINLPSYSGNSFCIYPKRSSVLMRNCQCVDNLPGNVYEIQAEHFFSQSDREAGIECSEHYIPEDDRDAGNLPRVLKLKVNCRVMLIRNILTEHGLVNGAMGTVSSVDIDPNTKVVSCIYVLFDDPTVGLPAGSLPNTRQTPISIMPFEHVYYLYGRCIVRKTFPLILSWACTIHKVQGMTVPKICIDLGSTVFQNGMAYVALSRVQSSEGLFIMALNPAVIKPSDEVLQEYENLRSRKL